MKRSFREMLTRFIQGQANITSQSVTFYLEGKIRRANLDREYREIEEGVDSVPPGKPNEHVVAYCDEFGD